MKELGEFEANLVEMKRRPPNSLGQSFPCIVI